MVALLGGIAECRKDVGFFQVGMVIKDFLMAGTDSKRPRMSFTRMRSPRIQGRPPHLPGSMVMRSLRFMVFPLVSTRLIILQDSGILLCGQPQSLRCSAYLQACPHSTIFGCSTRRMSCGCTPTR